MINIECLINPCSFLKDRADYLTALDRRYGLFDLVSFYDINKDVAIQQLFKIRNHIEKNRFNLSEESYQAQSIIQLSNWLKANYDTRKNRSKLYMD